MQQLIQLYNNTFGTEPKACTLLAGAGSNRHYYRLQHHDNTTIIGVVGTQKDENEAFIYLTKHFTQQQLHVPEIIAVSNDAMRYLITDLGDVALFDTLKRCRENNVYDNEAVTLLKRTIGSLPQLQYEGARGLDFTKCYPLENFNEQSIRFDLNYFKYCYLKLTGIEFNELLLENDFDKMVQILLEEQTNTFMYRDFQARNVMLVDNTPYFIDYQGGRRGAIYYDVASFLWQAKAAYNDELRQQLIDTYLNKLQQYRTISKTEFMAKLRHFVLFRTMQVLGAYGFRGLHERKPHFVESIPHALNNLKDIIAQPFSEYPYLMELLNKLVNTPPKQEQETKKLTVEVLSFSFKNGYPYDASGNGGGYIFDCRALHNPGRYDEYKQLTGRDKEVIAFLQQYNEVDEYLQHIYALLDSHVQRYQQRGFTNLQVAFGCTGGQHRSVYCAEMVAKYLKDKYDITIKVHHREQKIKYEL